LQESCGSVRANEKLTLTGSSFIITGPKYIMKIPVTENHFYCSMILLVLLTRGTLLWKFTQNNSGQYLNSLL
jgi:hypothetical protein